ncbi:MAG: pentapeptide repeat-containing protein, partial [Limisphaerales bacterium]
RDLSGADFTGADLSDGALSGANLTGALLVGTDCSGSDLSGDQLASAADRRGANLSGLDLSGADLSRVDFTGCDLRGADLSGTGGSASQLSGTLFTAGAILAGLDFSGADVSGLDFTGTDLTGTELSGSNLSLAQLRSMGVTREIKLRGYDFSGMDLSGIDLSTADLAAAVVQTAFVVVTTLEDELDIPSGEGSGISLREALRDAAGGITVRFDGGLEGGRVVLISGEIVLERSVEVDGRSLARGLTLDGGHAGRIFYIGAEQVEVGLYGLSLTGGTGEGLEPGWGGAVYSAGSLRVSECTLAGNSAGLGGGGIASIGVLHVEQSTFSGNAAIQEGGGILSSGEVELVHCTVAGNEAASGGGVRAGSGVIQLENTIVAQNSGGAGFVDLSVADGVAMATVGVNFVGELAGSGLVTGVGVLTGPAMLAPLGHYGGRSLTMRPLLGSPVIDAGGEATDLESDQRGLGFERLLNGALDLGAVESAVLANSATQLEFRANFSTNQLDSLIQWEIATNPDFASTASVDTLFQVGAGGFPAGVTSDRSGNIYYVDQGDNSVRMVDFQGRGRLVAGGTGFGFVNGDGEVAQFAQPSGLAVGRDGTLYVADTYNHCVRVISPGGVVSTLAGYGQAGYRDGRGSAAWFHTPAAIALAPDGALYVADTYNHRIRRVTLEGVVTTVAGSGVMGLDESGEAVGALVASFNRPAGVAVSAAGDIYIADTGNNRIRMVSSDSGAVVTYAEEHLNAPGGLALDPTGILYVANRGGNEILRVEGGVVSRLAGGGGAGFGDDADPLMARFNSPSDVAINNVNGQLMVADGENHRLRRVVFSKTTVPGGELDGIGLVVGLPPGATNYFRWLTLTEFGPTHGFSVPKPTLGLRDVTAGGLFVLDDQTTRVEIRDGGEEFAIRNDGNYPLTISEIRLSPGYTLIESPSANKPWVVYPDTDRSFKVMPLVGARPGSISIRSDELESSQGSYDFPVHRALPASVLNVGTSGLSDGSASFIGAIDPNGWVVTEVAFEVSTDGRMRDSWSLQALLTAGVEVRDV